MEYDTSQHERRMHPRYQVPSLVIAVPQTPDSQVGRIVNVSKGGMAVRYVDQKDWLGEAKEISILVNSNFFMTDIPIKNIRDFKVEDQVSFSNIHERQCCLQFDSLSPEQESLLDDFIMNHSAGNS